MFNQTHGFGKTLLLLVFVLLFGCGGNKTPEMTTPVGGGNTDAAPVTSDFMPLETAKTAVDLPFLVDSDGIVDTNCFKAVGGVGSEPSNEEIAGLIAQNTSAISGAIGNWFLNDLDLAGLDEDVVGGWQVAVADPQVAAIPGEDLRFAEGQECIGKGTAKLSKGVTAVVRLIGAREFTFTATEPISMDIQEEMIAAVSAYNIVLESPDLFVWEVARDSDNEPRVDENGEELYKNPEGELIPESQVPAEDERGMKNWTLKAESPIYFAYAGMTDDYWRREGKKKRCDVYLVWGDVTTRMPECEEFQEVGFSAKKAGDDVEVTIASGEKVKKETLAYGENEMIQVDDRVIVWVKPKKIEEGVLLQLNSLVLSPRPMANAPAPVEDEPSAPAPASSDKPKKKKKGKQTDQQSVDNYLNN